MTVFLWIVQILLALMFAMAGVMKATQPKEKLLASLPWTADLSAGTIKLIGTAELLGVIGLILPAATGVLPWLTTLAAVGLAVIMVLAVITHARRHEPKSIAVNAVLLIAAVFVAWGRFGPYAF